MSLPVWDFTRPMFHPIDIPPIVPICLEKPKHTTTTTRHTFIPGPAIIVQEDPSFDALRICTNAHCITRDTKTHIPVPFKPSETVLPCTGHADCTAWQHSECYQNFVENICPGRKHTCSSDEGWYTIRIDPGEHIRMGEPDAVLLEQWQIPWMWVTLSDEYRWLIIEKNCLSEYDCAFPYRRNYDPYWDI
ncbi:hypothetical protein BJ508DRAFT_327419 [Ascobolus immersus RN42]|uniref:Uncharacterized protein n=1 Tax=Ascobolus immersus RN42 TaxID=1160509 RepID=A0A3N4I2I4_ASCIM|nr:hypothetical protein BJ508DRAFT_327419 [Ascobolus immersus RN42]